MLWKVIFMLCLYVNSAQSLNAENDRRLQTVYDAPSLPPGMEPWEKLKRGFDPDSPWYRYPNLFANELQSDLFGKPKKHTKFEMWRKKDAKASYWWVPKGTTNMTMGPWFPGGSSKTTLVQYFGERPPSPGAELEMDESFWCAFYDSDKKFMCYERKPHENQQDLTFGQDLLGNPLISLQERFSERCTLRFLNNVFLNRHEPTGSTFKDYPEYTLERGVTCRDVGYWFMPSPDSVFPNMQCFLMLDLTNPIQWLETSWNLMYAMGFYMVDVQLAPLGITTGLPMIQFIGSWLNTQRYTFYWKSVNQAWTR